jgi:DNA-binding MarR family transcriptional regulator
MFTLARRPGQARDLTDADYRGLARFRYLLRRFLRFSERAADAAGLEPRQYQLLLTLRGLAPDGAASVSELAEWLQVRHHSAVELIDRTAARGLVERRADPSDGRRVLVTLTPGGRSALAGLARLHRDELQRLAPMLLQALHDIPRGDEDA